jgi:hypothetical protein
MSRSGAGTAPASRADADNEREPDGAPNHRRNCPRLAGNVIQRLDRLRSYSRIIALCQQKMGASAVNCC